MKFVLPVFYIIVTESHDSVKMRQSLVENVKNRLHQVRRDDCAGVLIVEMVAGRERAETGCILLPQ